MIINVLIFEVRRLLMSPGSWIIIATVQFLLSFIFYTLLSRYLTEPALFEGRGLTDAVVAGYYRSAGLLFLLITPLITMRTISEDIRTGTIKLLLSSPLRVYHILLGKYLAVLCFMLFVLTIISLVPASLSIGTPLDYGQLLSCIIGLGLQLFCLTAMGLFFSSLFQSQSIAAVTSFAVILLTWTSHMAVDSYGTVTYEILNYLSMSRHFTAFTEGTISTSAASYFIVLSVFFLALGTWKVNAMRNLDW